MQALNTQEIEQISGGLLHTTQPTPPGFPFPPGYPFPSPTPTFPPTTGPIIF